MKVRCDNSRKRNLRAPDKKGANNWGLVNEKGLLKPCEVQVSCTVSRGRERGNLLLLPDKESHPTVSLKRGVSTGEVLSFLGKPVEVSERIEGKLRFSTYRFLRGEGRVTEAKIVEDVLVRSP